MTDGIEKVKNAVMDGLTSLTSDKIDVVEILDKTITEIKIKIGELTDENELTEFDEISDDDSGKDRTVISDCSAASPFAIFPGAIKEIFDGDSKDGKIDDTKQNATGDCWLLSAVNALSYTQQGRQVIKNALEYHDDYTIVHLATGDVKVSNFAVTQTKGSQQYSSGDDDMIIFELAIEQVLDDIANGDLELSEDAPWFMENMGALNSTSIGNSSTTGGWMLQALYYLTGITGCHATDKSEMENELDKYMQNNGQNYVLTAAIVEGSGTGYYVVEDVNGNQVELPNGHAYAIKSVDENTVTVINPWDSGEEIVLSRQTFLQTFSCTEGLDLKQKSNNGDYVKKTDD